MARRNLLNPALLNLSAVEPMRSYNQVKDPLKFIFADTTTATLAGGETTITRQFNINIPTGLNISNYKMTGLTWAIDYFNIGAGFRYNYTQRSRAFFDQVPVNAGSSDTVYIDGTFPRLIRPYPLVITGTGLLTLLEIEVLLETNAGVNDTCRFDVAAEFEINTI